MVLNTPYQLNPRRFRRFSPIRAGKQGIYIEVGGLDTPRRGRVRATPYHLDTSHGPVINPPPRVSEIMSG